jgi:hypothetical protein
MGVLHCSMQLSCCAIKQALGLDTESNQLIDVLI